MCCAFHMQNLFTHILRVNKCSYYANSFSSMLSGKINLDNFIFLCRFAETLLLHMALPTVIVRVNSSANFCSDNIQYNVVYSIHVIGWRE